MKNLGVQIQKTKVENGSVFIPKTVLQNSNLDLSNTVMLVLSPKTAHLKYFKQFLMFKKSIDAISESSSYFCLAVPTSQLSNILDFIKISNLPNNQKEIVLSYFYNHLITIKSNGECVLPKQYESYFSAGEFVCVGTKNKLEIWDYEDFKQMISFGVRKTKTTKTTKRKSTRKIVAKKSDI